MLAAEHRLRDSDAYRRTVRSGRRAGSAALVVHLAGPSADHAGPAFPARVGFVVGRGVGNAVVRNRVRRRLRHLVRAHVDELPTSSELVVRALAPSAELEFAELDVELTRCLDRVRRRSAPREEGSVKGARP